ncbi:histidine kinase [Microbacterium sp. Marseille-Q6648]|uniref:sensor histidine kinase n=1 Tax=Microbacterium sp. Marseille-Q6648 TaxID=2937991 RepID=UPI00203E7757|nr:histidine kinase [Microbacterium sp. Marseille-Q6648]
MLRPLTTHQVVVDLLVAGLFLVVAAPAELSIMGGVGSTGAASDAAGVLVAVVFTAALALRRLAPGPALATAWLGAVVQMGLGRPPSVSDVAIFGVLYATAAYGSTLVLRLGLVSALVGAVVITAYLTFDQFYGGGGALTWQTLPLALVMLAAAAFALALSWTIGALVRTARRARATRLAQERAESEAVAEQERVRIARDMHDVVAHSLTVVVAQADGARYAAASDPAAATVALETISSTARAALADVRVLLTQLRHSQTHGPQPALADLEQLYAQVRAAGVAVRVEVDPAPVAEPSAAVQLAVYRILQEALTNALRHGDGESVSVRLCWHPDRVDLEVRNPLPATAGTHGVTGSGAAGSGAAGAGAPGPRGHGLIGMAERASLVGGILRAERREGVFVVDATLPIGAPA